MNPSRPLAVADRNLTPKRRPVVTTGQQATAQDLIRALPNRYTWLVD